MQKQESSWTPVAFASRTMTETERRYAQIEKEALAITWACEKFSTYILGMKFLIETDHKPLIPLLGTKHLDSLPPRILRLRLGRYDYDITHVPGKLLYTADTLSRAPVPTNENDSRLQEETDALMDLCVYHLPASKERLDEYRKSQATDPICSSVIKFCRHGWPEKSRIEPDIRPYWLVHGELTFDNNNLLLYGKRIVVPKALQRQTLLKIHQGHQGIQRCRLRANTSVWWPGLLNEINNMVKQCSTCARDYKPHKEPMIPSPLPVYPWQRVGSDLFHFKGANYILAVDYFSRYPEICKLSNTTSYSIIEALKTMFSRHGVPETLVSDNGPQYSSLEFAAHVTSSPYFPQSNGQAERTVQTVKNLLKDSTDHHMALLTYRSTPFPWCNLSPAELLMGRRIRSNIPFIKDQLVPKWEFLEEFKNNNISVKENQKRVYDRRHRTRPLPVLLDDTDVWITGDTQPISGRVNASANTPRSYIVQTSSGKVRRNRHHLNKVPETCHLSESSNTIPSPNIIMTRSRTGTIIHPPDRFGYPP